MTAIVGLGANLGDRESNIKSALLALDGLASTRVERVSGMYETQAVGVPDEQPDYINCVAVLQTELSARALLGACLGIESALGRRRAGYKAARTIDIDLLVYEGVTSRDEELMLPHPRMLERAFVLVPLKELYPQGNVCGLEFSDKLRETQGQIIKSL